ncbi:MAG: phosphate acyltransferase PlsX [Gammaproteobacteria bacterium]
MKIKIAVDAMGGDFGPSVVVPACVHALSRHPELRVILTGNETAIEEALLGADGRGNEQQRLLVVHTAQQVEMHELPSSALRNKKDSSMRVAVDLVKTGSADACVSAGNTGALVAMAKFVLKTLPGIDRPAICNAMPGMEKHCHLLDLGANVNSSPEQLFQFAVMGSVLASALDNRDRPSVALLNIGEEEIKGNEKVKQTSAMLSASELNYVGFVEGDDIYQGKADVIVCDGFVGNVALKASEGVARMLAFFAKEAYSRSLFTRAVALLSKPILVQLGRRADPRHYNGASLLGLRGIVIKSHGSADWLSFSNAITEAVKEVKKDVPSRISQRLEAILLKRAAV